MGAPRRRPRWSSSTPTWLVVPRNGGLTFHDRGGPYGRTKGAKRIVAVDVTGLPVGALVVSASTHENRASELMLAHLGGRGSAPSGQRSGSGPSERPWSAPDERAPETFGPWDQELIAKELDKLQRLARRHPRQPLTIETE